MFYGGSAMQNTYSEAFRNVLAHPLEMSFGNIGIQFHDLDCGLVFLVLGVCLVVVATVLYLIKTGGAVRSARHSEP